MIRKDLGFLGAAGATALSVFLGAKKVFAQPEFGSELDEFEVGRGGGFLEDAEPDLADVPASTFGDSTAAIDTLDEWINGIGFIIVGVLFIMFIYDLIQLFRTGEAEWGKKAVRAIILFGIGVGIMGILNVVGNNTGIGLGGIINRPGL